MKRVILVILSFLFFGSLVFAASSSPTHETKFNAPPILRNLVVPTTGLVVTALTPGIVSIAPVSGKVYISLTAVTPNAYVHNFYVSAGSIGGTDQYYEVGDKLALLSDSGTITVNMTTQSWKVLPK